MISEQSLSTIQKSINEAILESQTTAVATEELIEPNEIEAAQVSPAEIPSDDLTISRPSDDVTISRPSDDLTISRPSDDLTISRPSEDPIPCSNFLDEPAIPSQQEECSDPYRHRAILDLGAELFHHLDDLKGVDGEYVLHILEVTEARLQLPPPVLFS